MKTSTMLGNHASTSKPVPTRKPTEVNIHKKFNEEKFFKKKK